MRLNKKFDSFIFKNELEGGNNIYKFLIPEEVLVRLEKKTFYPLKYTSSSTNSIFAFTCSATSVSEKNINIFHSFTFFSNVFRKEATILKENRILQSSGGSSLVCYIIGGNRNLLPTKVSTLDFSFSIVKTIEKVEYFSFSCLVLSRTLTIDTTPIYPNLKGTPTELLMFCGIHFGFYFYLNIYSFSMLSETDSLINRNISPQFSAGKIGNQIKIKIAGGVRKNKNIKYDIIRDYLLETRTITLRQQKLEIPLSCLAGLNTPDTGYLVGGLGNNNSYYRKITIFRNFDSSSETIAFSSDLSFPFCSNIGITNYENTLSFY